MQRTWGKRESEVFTSSRELKQAEILHASAYKLPNRRLADTSTTHSKRCGTVAEVVVKKGAVLQVAYSTGNIYTAWVIRRGSLFFREKTESQGSRHTLPFHKGKSVVDSSQSPGVQELAIMSLGCKQ